jgi:hypothetical protein
MKKPSNRKIRGVGGSILAGLAILGLGVGSPAAMAAGDANASTARVSVATDGTQTDSFSFSHAPKSISGNGRYVAFESAASNLVAGDTNSAYDVFVRDSQTNNTQRISVANTGEQADGDSASASLSSGGRYVAFVSSATNLVAGDTNGHSDIFVRDRLAGTTKRASVASNGTQGDADSGFAEPPKVSDNGRYVFFESTATNFVPGDTNGTLDVFVHDFLTGNTNRVSVSNRGAQSSGSSYGPAISSDGRYVAFLSNSSDLVGGDTNNVTDIFVRDRLAGTTRRISIATNGTQGDGESDLPSISGDGRYVAYNSTSTNLVPGDTNGAFDVFVHDRQTNTTQRVSTSSTGIQGNSDSRSAAISGNGRYVAFHSAASNFDSGDTNSDFDIFVKDRQTGAISRADVATDGTFANAGAVRPSISNDGRFVSFDSTATNLVPSDTNGLIDIFVRQRF